MKKSHNNPSKPAIQGAGTREGVALVATLAVASGVHANAQDTSGGTLPAQVVEADKPAPKPKPKPAPRPAPRRAPAPQPAPIVHEPIVLDDQSYVVPQVSSTKYTTPLRDVPQSVQVLTSDLMKQQGAMSLREALKSTPGITINGGEGGGGLQGDALVIRGFSARSDIYIDGVRDYGMSNRDPFNYEQIEIYKGPSSANSGRGSTGGAVNMVTKTPRLDSFTHIDGSTSLISGEHLYRATIDINQPLYINRDSHTSGGKADFSGKGVYGGGKTVYGNESGAAFRLNLLYHDQEVPGRDMVEYERWGVAPSIAFGLGTDTRLTFSYLHLEEDNVPDFGIPWAGWKGGPRDPGLWGGVNYDNFYGFANHDFEHITNDVFSADFQHDFSDDLKLRNFTRWARSERTGLTTNGRGNGPVIARGGRHGREFNNEIFSNTTEITASFDTGNVGHTVVAGFEFAQQDLSNTTFSPLPGVAPDTDLFNPTPRDLAPNAGPIGAPTLTEVQTTSLYLFDTIDLNEHWQLSGGLRYDHLDTDYHDVPSGTRLGRTDDLVSWRSAINYKPVENGSIYLAYSTSYEPSAEQNLGLALEDRYGVDHSNLDPEESQTIELGTKWDLYDGRLALAGALFKTEKTNARSPGILPNTYELNGGVEVQGVELGVAGKLNDWWTVYGGYTYLESEITKPLVEAAAGNEQGNVPDHSFSLWSVFDVTSKLQLGGGVQYVGQRFSDFRNNNLLDDYVTVDALIGYQVNENLSLRVNARNLLDERYEDRPARGHFIPGEGRSVTLSASIKY